MANMELPLTLDEQVEMMKKYVSFRQRIKMKKFLEYAGYFRASRYGKYLLSHIENTGSKSKQDILSEVLHSYKGRTRCKNKKTKYRIFS